MSSTNLNRWKAKIGKLYAVSSEGSYPKRQLFQASVAKLINMAET